jgi:hypothetical protein
MEPVGEVEGESRYYHEAQYYVVAHPFRVATRKLGVESPERVFACDLISVHLLDTLLTVASNLTTRRQAPGGALRSIEAAARGTTAELIDA